MNWATHNHQRSARAEPPAPDRLVVYWRVVSGSGRIMTCGLYLTRANYLEVRVSYDHDQLLQSQLVPSPEDGRLLSILWMDDVRATGRFTELPDGPVHSA